jgi:hypothetical protein
MVFQEQLHNSSDSYSISIQYFIFAYHFKFEMAQACLMIQVTIFLFLNHRHTSTPTGINSAMHWQITKQILRLVIHWQTIHQSDLELGRPSGCQSRWIQHSGWIGPKTKNY